jgi:hypothetical protein
MLSISIRSQQHYSSDLMSIVHVCKVPANDTIVEGFGGNETGGVANLLVGKADLEETDAFSGVWTESNNELYSDAESFLGMQAFPCV